MKALIIVLIIAAFLQATILPLDLILIILTCRSFIKSGKSNLYLAFASGLFLGHLTLTPMGLQSIIFLILIQATESLSKSRLSENPLSLIPICFIAIALNQITLSLFTQSTLQLTPKIYEAILALPIFYFVRFWEERFIVRREIKLRI